MPQPALMVILPGPPVDAPASVPVSSCGTPIDAQTRSKRLVIRVRQSTRNSLSPGNTSPTGVTPAASQPAVPPAIGCNKWIARIESCTDRWWRLARDGTSALSGRCPSLACSFPSATRSSTSDSDGSSSCPGQTDTRTCCAPVPLAPSLGCSCSVSPEEIRVAVVQCHSIRLDQS